MDLGVVFAPVVKHVEVAHPAGAKFRLYPQPSPEPWQVLARKIPLKRLETVEAYFSALNAAADGKAPRPLASDYFETGEDIIAIERMILAAHIAGWSDLTLNGEELPFSLETADKLLESYPPFGEWITEEIRRLGQEASSKSELAKAIEGN